MGFDVKIDGIYYTNYRSLTAGVTKKRALELLEPHFGPGSLSEGDLSNVSRSIGACSPALLH